MLNRMLLRQMIVYMRDSVGEGPDPPANNCEAIIGFPEGK